MGHIYSLNRSRQPRQSAYRHRPGQSWLFCIVIAVLCLTSGAGCDACESCDRSTRSPSPDTSDLVYRTPAGGIIVVERPSIPEPLRRNCDVCPYWCQHVNLNPLPHKTVIETYRLHAEIYAGHGKRQHPSDGRPAVERMACLVAGGSAHLQRRFAGLLHDPSPAIRFPTAILMLVHDIDVPAAVAALRAMVKSVREHDASSGPDGDDLASRAHFALLEYETGGIVELP